MDLSRAHFSEGELQHGTAYLYARNRLGSVTNLLTPQGTVVDTVSYSPYGRLPSREQARNAFERFVHTYRAKYPKAIACLVNDREELLAFYDFPAEHWVHLRTTNPIESTFATVRHRTDRAKGCVSRDTMLTMIYKLGMCAERRWRRIRGFSHLAKVVAGAKFKDGVEVTERADSRNAA